MEVIIDGVRFVPQRNGGNHKLPLSVLLYDARVNLKRETLDEASQRMGISKSSLHAMEQGTTLPGLAMLQKLLYYYGISFIQIAKADDTGGGQKCG